MLKSILRIVVVLVVSSLVSLPAITHAEEIPAEFNTGDWEFILGGSGSSDKDFDATALSLEANVGYFFTDHVELIIRQGIAVADLTDESSWSGSTRLGLDYNFNVNNLKPFLGVNIGYLYGDDVEETFIAGPEAGIKYFLNTTTFINVQAEYQFLFENADEADDQFDDGRYVYTIGMGIKW